jgi:hypothetical protein
MALRKQHFDDNNEQAPHRGEQAQLTIGIDTALLRRIEKAAAEQKLSVEEYLAPLLDQVVPDDTSKIEEQNPPPTSELLQRVLQVRARIMEESGGHLFEDSAEAVRRMREERTQYLEQLREQKWETK